MAKTASSSRGSSPSGARRPARARRSAATARIIEAEVVYRARGLRLLSGVDEAGVGPLAGPVVAAAVIMPPDSRIEGVNDSKTISPVRREALAALVRAEAVTWGVGMARPREIDRVNIYHATLAAMRRAVLRLDPSPELVLVDARTIPGIDTPQEAHVKGDARFYQIACASILAKETRDAIMRHLDRRHPGYGFARHMGYPTTEHRDAIRELGPCYAHRRTFRWLPEEENSQLDLDALWGDG